MFFLTKKCTIEGTELRQAVCEIMRQIVYFLTFFTHYPKKEGSHEQKFALSVL